MSNLRRIEKKIEKIYKRPIDNLYSYSFYRDLFSGYSYSLREMRFDREDFFKIISSDNDVKKLFFTNGLNYNFSYDLEQAIGNALYSLALYGKSYLIIKPNYTEKKENDENNCRALSSIHINEIKGVKKKNVFYYRTFKNEISKLDISKESLILLDLKDLGYKRNYFTNLVRKLGRYDFTSDVNKLINDEPTYNYEIHVDKNQKKFLKAVSDIGWRFGTEDLSDSYILYKEIKMKIFKIKLLQYVLDKINKDLVDNYIQDKSFKIEALIKKVDYEEIWEKYKCGELMISDLNKIVW